jgi:uncharacterized protein
VTTTADPRLAPADAAPFTGVTIAVLAKVPVPGKVKTRLCPPCTSEQAAALAAAALADTLDAVSAAVGVLQPSVSRAVLVLDGAADAAVAIGARAAGFVVIPQRGDGLDERLSAAFTDIGGPTLLVGMDTPQVSPALLRTAVDRLARPGCDAVLGPAVDGGYWAVGLRSPDPLAFLGIPMSTAETGAAQRRRLDGRGLAVTTLPVLRDVDTADDAWIVARQAPHTRFAQAAARILGPDGVAGPGGRPRGHSTDDA